MTVYFVRRGQEGPVKIGHARSIGKRLASLQVASPEDLVLLRVAPGGRAEELALHARFSSVRIHPKREWFLPSDDLLSFIYSLPETEIQEAPPKKKPISSATLRSQMGKVGGRVRAERLSPERRQEIARKAAESRWARK